MSYGLVAGVDSSTQSCKVVIRDTRSGEVIRRGRAAHPPGTEVDPRAWWEALLSAVADAGGLDDVAAISVAGQQHGMVVLDDRGDIIRPALLWNDTRSADAAESLVREHGAASLARRTGSVPVASFTSTKLRWLRDVEPEHADRVAAVALPHDWLTWRLLGRGGGGGLEALTTDRSDASGTGYWNSASEAWDEELLVSALGHGALLPRVVAPDGISGDTDGTVPGIPAGIRVGAGAGDNAAAALGLAMGAGDVGVSLGTSGTVFAVTDTPTADPSGAVAGFADATGRHLPLIATLNAARVLDAIATLLDVTHDQLGRLALQARAGSSGLVLRPYFEGERTPNLPDATASLHGMTLGSTTRENLARAAVEGMLCGLADGFDAVRRQGVNADRILVIGGAAQNPAVAEIATQVFDSDISVPAPGEYVADGAAVQAAWALTGERPNWPVATALIPLRERAPIIRAQYEVAPLG